MRAEVLAGPQVDSLRVALRSPGVVDPWAMDLLRDAKKRALAIRGCADYAGVDVALRWPNPSERLSQVPVDLFDPISGEVIQFWDRGSVQVLPKIGRGPVLADLQSAAGGPGFIRIRGGGPSKRYPYAVILDLSSQWLWRHGSPGRATLKAIEWWAAAEVLVTEADQALSNGFEHRVTRCDIAVDHIYPRGWVPDDHRFFATRAHIAGFEVGTLQERKMAAPESACNAIAAPDLDPGVGENLPDTPPASCYFGPRSFTLYLGKRGGSGPMFRIYDKTAQLAATRPRGAKTAWFWNPISELWTARGWNRADKVWRCEVEIPSKMLHSMDGGNARMSHIGALDVMRLWSHVTRHTRHTESAFGQARDRVTSDLWSMIANAKGDHGLIEVIPSAPELEAPDLAAVVFAVRKAIELGAVQAEVLRNVSDAIGQGETRRARRDDRAARVVAIEARHAKPAP